MTTQSGVDVMKGMTDIRLLVEVIRSTTKAGNRPLANHMLITIAGTIEAQAAEIIALRSANEGLTATLEDEQVAHMETLDLLRAERSRVAEAERVGIERAAKVAKHGCLVPPDGGEPTAAEIALCDEIASRISALSASTEPPAGYKLVPVEPTQEMSNAAAETKGQMSYADVYRAMLAAAPKFEGDPK